MAVLVILGYVVMSRRRTVSPYGLQPEEITQYEGTFLEDPSQSDLYNSGGVPPSASQMPNQTIEVGSMDWLYGQGGTIRPASPQRTSDTLEAPLMPMSAQLSDDDELLITQMVEEADFQQRQRDSESDVVAWLRLVGTRQDYEIKRSLLIGRRNTCDVVIRDDPSVSGEHARLEVRDGHHVWLIVLSRTNPVLVSGVILNHQQERQLLEQDMIQLSPETKLIFIRREGSDDDDFDDGVTII